ncbi:MAG TPA: hypothetical protein VJB59_09930 [Bdellovibrionota bacterium]|nr:hypothetical protein [Bdellovibrionota bacterium]
MASTLKIDNRRDVMLLLFFSPGKSEQFNEPIIGRTRLVKMLFLFRREALQHFKQGTEVTDDNFYEFFPWNFGPFSVDVYDDLTFFILREFIKSNQSDEETVLESIEEQQKWLDQSALEAEDAPTEVQEYEETFQLSERGYNFAKTIYDTLSQNQKKLLQEFKTRTATVPLRALLRYVYQQYPEMTTKSRIKEQVLGGP